MKELKDGKRENNKKREKVIRFHFGISVLFNILIRYGHRFCWLTLPNESRSTYEKEFFTSSARHARIYTVKQ